MNLREIDFQNFISDPKVQEVLDQIFIDEKQTSNQKVPIEIDKVVVENFQKRDFTCLKTSLETPIKSFYKVRKGRIWRSDEDVKLRALVGIHGLNKWKKIAIEMDNKTNRQCAARWNQTLDPSINRNKWTKEEDQLLKKLVMKYGTHQWKMIALKMLTRKRWQCRTRWLSTHQAKPAKKIYLKNKNGPLEQTLYKMGFSYLLC